MFASSDPVRIKVLGIDPGLTTTGYGVVSLRANSVRALTAGVIRTNRDCPVPVRLRVLFDDIEALIAESDPGVMAIERVFVNQNKLTATQVGEAAGVMLLAAARAGIEVFEYSPSGIKAVVTGDGRATKTQVQQMVARRLGLRQAPAPADAADALAIALCHLQSVGNRVGRVAARS